MLTSDELKNGLRLIFDSQIPNYGDYNLIYASLVRTSMVRTRPDRAPAERKPQRENARDTETRDTDTRHFVLGYRRQPMELVVAPFNGMALSPGSLPVDINMTNLSHAFLLGDGDYEVGTSTGTTFRFVVRARGILTAGDGTAVAIEQQHDHADFVAFMSELIKIA